MPTGAVITTLIALLAVLVCYTFIHQTLQIKQEQKRRLLAALRSRSRAFTFMTSGCLETLLPRDILLLVQLNLVDITQQLAKLEPNVNQHRHDLTLLNTKIANTHKMARAPDYVHMENTGQVNETKASLDELHRFVIQLEAKESLPGKQADAFREQITRLVLLITADEHVLNGIAARADEKIKLATHYFELALNLLLRENADNAYDIYITRLKSTLDELEAEIDQEQKNTSQIAEENTLTPTPPPKDNKKWSKSDNRGGL